MTVHPTELWNVDLKVTVKHSALHKKMTSAHSFTRFTDQVMHKSGQPMVVNPSLSLFQANQIISKASN